MSRETRRATIEHRIRAVKKLEKELDDVWTARRNLGYIELKKPIRNGWFRTFVLRDDVARSKMAKTYQEVLDAVICEIWGREKKYADKNWKEFFRNAHLYFFQRPGIKRLNSKKFDALSGKAKKCFRQIKIKEYSSYRTFYVCTIPRYYFVVSYRRAYITKIKIISPVLESRYQEIFEKLETSNLRSFSNYFGHHFGFYEEPHRGERKKVKDTLLQYKNTFNQDPKSAYYEVDNGQLLHLLYPANLKNKY